MSVPNSPATAAIGAIALARDPAVLLPTEILNECFRRLDLDDRISISHVCRAWRDVALCDPSLWNTTSALGHYRRTTAGKLRALLLRSDPLPFTLTFGTSYAFPSIPRKFFRVFFNYMHRMQHLTLLEIPPSDIEIIFGYDAPVLRSFVWGCFGKECALPTRWGVERAPVLDTLCLRSFYVPREMEPLLALRSFTSQFGSFSGGTLGLSTIFPYLETLHITSTKQDELQYICDIPPSLRSISLEIDIHFPLQAGIDYESLFLACPKANVERLCVEAAVDYLGALQLFTATTRGTWELRVRTYNNNEINIRACDEPVDYTIHCYQPVSPSHQPSIATYLERVSLLSVGLDTLKELATLDSWDRHLPALHHLEIYFYDRVCHHATDHPRMTAGTMPRKVYAPHLELVRLFLSGPLSRGQSWILECFPAILQTLVSYERQRLESITILEHGFSCLNRQDLFGMMSLAECVRVNSEGQDDLREFSLFDPIDIVIPSTM